MSLHPIARLLLAGVWPLLLSGVAKAQESGRATIRIPGQTGTIPSPGQACPPDTTALGGIASQRPANQARLVVAPAAPNPDNQVRTVGHFVPARRADSAPEPGSPWETTVAGNSIQDPDQPPVLDDEAQRRQDERINPFDPNANRGQRIGEGIEPVEQRPAAPGGGQQILPPPARPMLPGERLIPPSPPPVAIPDQECAPLRGFPGGGWPNRDPGQFLPPAPAPQPTFADSALLESDDVVLWPYEQGGPVDGAVIEPAPGMGMWQTGPVRSGGGCCSPLFYFDLLGGTSQMDDVAGSTVENRSGVTGLRFDSGYSLGTRVGLFQGQNLRTDFEFSLRHNEFELTRDFAPDLGPGQSIPVGATGRGDWTLLQGMSNVAWDFRRVRLIGWKPYVGVGVGFVSVQSDATSFVPAGGRRILERDSSIAFQTFVGASRQVTSRLDLFLEYRWLTADPFVLSTESGAWVDGTTVQSALRNDRYDVSGESFVAGLRMKF